MTRLRPLGALLWALASLFLAAGFWAALRAAPELSPFVVRTVRVEGVERAEAAEVVEAARVARGGNLFAVDVQAVRRAVEQLPWIRTARVSRTVPSTLTIAVEEWQPAFLVRLDRLYYLSREGHVIRAPVDRGFDYPVVTGVTWADLEAPGPARTSLLELLASLDRAAPASEVSEVHADPRAGYTVYAGDERVQGIHLGQGALGAKFERLARLRRHLERRGLAARTVNLTYDDKIIARVVDAAGKSEVP